MDKSMNINPDLIKKIADLKPVTIDQNLIKSFNSPILDISNLQKLEEQHTKTIEQLAESRRAKEAEELRRHNELIATLKSAAENGATIIIGDNATDVQIQQNAINSNQTISNIESFDYEKVVGVLKEIKEYFDIPHFSKAFNDSSNEVKELVENTIVAAEQKKDPNIIKKSLKLLKDLSINVGSNMIASGIIALLATVI